MILQALCEHYDRLLQRGDTELSPYGYSLESISYCISLSPSGEPLEVLPLLDTSGKTARPRLLCVPLPVNRRSNIASNFLWDKTSYALGVSATSKRTQQEHDDFRRAHRDALRGCDDAGMKALLAFLDAWTPDRFALPPFSDEMKDKNVVFRLDGERQYLHERPAAREIRARLLSTDATADGDDASAIGMCLVTGETGPIARLHPVIKGVDGAQSSGASIVSFNQESFASWNKTQGANAPVSARAAFAYTEVLKQLLRRDVASPRRFKVGDTTVVFWAETDEPAEADAAEDALAAMLASDAHDTDAQAEAKIARAAEVIAQGLPLESIDPHLLPGTRMFLLGLAPNAARISIRFVLRDTFGRLAQRLRDHALDLRLEPAPWKKPPSPWRLALVTAPLREGRHKQDDVSPRLAGDLMGAILTGQRYPRSLLSALLLRMRSDGDVSGLRVALCKAVLNRDARLSAPSDPAAPLEEIPMSLDTDDANPAYLLGRLFATLEGAQYAALGGNVNATIRDRYFGAASATPALVFPVLLRNAQNHLARLRKDRPGAAVNLEKDLREIVDKLPSHFPRSLALQDQGRFAIGYYHQSESRFRKAADKGSVDNSGPANADVEADVAAH